ncbi:MAG: hypothetical protein C4522_15910 [Desulfobacteraceae bacterium]|nr:MAG: hypothetical protein C4522_15910 [Desulfobacteraceae bacterium]
MNHSGFIFKRTIISLAFIFLCQPIVIQAEAAVITFLPRLSVEEEYTSNFFLTRDREEDDFSTIVTPGFVTQLQGKMSSIAFYYDPAYHYYSDHTEYNGWSHSAGLTGTHRAAKNTTIDFVNSFLYTSEPSVTPNTVATYMGESSTTESSVTRPAPSFDSGPTHISGSSGATSSFDSIGSQDTQILNRDISLRRSRETYYTNNANLGLTRQFGINDSMHLDYTYTILENDDPGIDDNQSHSPSILFSYWFVPNQWRVETGGAYTRGLYDGLSDDFNSWQADVEIFRQFDRHIEGLIRYSHSSISFDGDTEDYQVYNPSIGIRYITQEGTNIHVSVGYYVQDRKISEDDSGFIVNCDLEKSWSYRQASIQLSGSSGYDLSYLDAANLGFRLYYGAGINAQYRFTRHTTGYLFSSYQWDDYPSDPSSAGEDREDHNLEYGLGFSYRALSWLSTRIQGSTRLVKSSIHVSDPDDDPDFVDNRVLLGITISPSQPYRY